MPHFDLDALDLLHDAAQRGMDDTDGECIAAWRRATYVQWPAISKEIRAMRADLAAAVKDAAWWKQYGEEKARVLALANSQVEAAVKRAEEAEKYGAPENATVLAFVKSPCKQHNGYWTTITGRCMACRAAAAEARAARFEGALREIEEGRIFQTSSVPITIARTAITPPEGDAR